MSGTLQRLGIEELNTGAWAGAPIPSTGEGSVASTNPSTGEVLARVQMASKADYEVIVGAAHEAWLRWRMLPAPKRGEIVREMGDAMVTEQVTEADITGVINA